MICHVSVLSPGRSPHPPHAHADEELLIVLQGVAEIIMADDPNASNARSLRLKPGTFSYYPAGQHHTIRNPGDTALAYLMFRWQRPASHAARPLATSVVDTALARPDPSPKPFSVTPLLQHPTHYLDRLHAHLTVLQPGAGYAPHADAYDVAILLLSGKVRTLGYEAPAPALIYYCAGLEHGMSNAGAEPARYLVFEFHGPRRAPTGGVPSGATTHG
jgi:quercetin dioxygenase-like cupin family protein